MVNQRFIRDRYKILATKYKQKKAAEEKASGVSPEHTEIDDAVEEIEDLFNKSDLEREALLGEKKRKIEEGKEKAVELR